MKNIFLLYLLILFGCNQVPSTVPTPAPSSYQTPVAPVLLSQTSFSTSTPNPISKSLPLGNGPKYGAEQSKSIVSVQDDGGQAGLFVISSPTYIGIYANNSADPNLELNPTTSSSLVNYLYAPTTKLGGGCIEFSTDYWRTSTGDTYRDLRPYDFCSAGWATEADKVIDATFASSYLRDFGNGALQFTTEILLGQDQSTRVLIYNYQAQKWELVYTSIAASNNYNGESWDMFETHYTPGACSVVSTIVSSNIKLLTNLNTWVDVLSSNIDTGSQSYFGQCFTSPGNTNTLIWEPTYTQWMVTSSSN